MGALPGAAARVWGKNGANRAPFYAPQCPFSVSPVATKKRPSPLYMGLGRLMVLIPQHNRGVLFSVADVKKGVGSSATR